jgi:hypothetical protein
VDDDACSDRDLVLQLGHFNRALLGHFSRAPKTSKVIDLLRREGGATLTEIMKKMGWQQHTTRALMSGGGALAKKHGLIVKSAKAENGDRIYSL